MTAPAHERWLDSDLAEIAPVRKWVTELAGRSGFDPHAAHQLGVAVTEALTNVVRHAYADRRGRIRVEVAFADRVLTIRVAHWGKPFDESRWERPDLDREQVGGYGVLLMRRYTDQVRHEAMEGDGTMITMRRALAEGGGA